MLKIPIHPNRGISSRNGEDVLAMENTLTHRLAVRFADILNQYVPKEGLAYRKVVLGSEVILINISKLTIIFVIAAFLKMAPQTLFVLIGFNVLRQTAFGLHALTSTGCTITSITVFIIIPYFLQGVGLSSIAVALIFILIFVAMYLYAPADTKARPIIGAKKRQMLKRKTMISCMALAVILIALPYHLNDIKLMFTLGAIYATISILPITYKILRRECENYERYEQAQVNQD